VAVGPFVVEDELYTTMEITSLSHMCCAPHFKIQKDTCIPSQVATTTKNTPVTATVIIPSQVVQYAQRNTLVSKRNFYNEEILSCCKLYPHIFIKSTYKIRYVINYKVISYFILSYMRLEFFLFNI